MTIDSNYLFEVSVEIAQIFDKLAVFPDHRLSTEYSSQMLTSRVDFRKVSHY